MAKHSYEDLEQRESMSCTRVYPSGIGFDNGEPVEMITITRDVHSDTATYVYATGMVPSRPTGAHRQSDNVWADANVVILVDDPVHGPSFECPREWQDGMSVGFDYITVPHV